jgi:hypothetical protein
MKKVIGIILIISALALLVMIFYSKLIAAENDLTWFSLIVPVLFIYQGLSYLKSPLQINASVTTPVAKKSNLDIEVAFDPVKRNSLISKLKAMPGEPVIPIQEFLDGNLNDLGSIGCNLYPSHPGIAIFRSVFESLLSRSDVSEIYAHISEIEPDEESWPFTDRIYVFGSISSESLAKETKLIQPTEVGEPNRFFSKLPNEIKALNSNSVKVLWWD